MRVTNHQIRTNIAMVMKLNLKYTFSIIVLLVAAIFNTLDAQHPVMQADDPVITYNPFNPPADPGWGTVHDWVRTRRIGSNNFDTEPYKAYIYGDLPFRLKYPENFDENDTNTTYPLIIMFHGLGEPGTKYDNELQLWNGGKEHLEAVQNGVFNGFVMFPQNHTGHFGPNDFTAIHNMINNDFPLLHVDLSRISLHGLSAGAKGVWEYVAQYPEDIASFLPMSNVAVSYHNEIDTYKTIPTWVFQGEKDKNPPPEEAYRLLDLFTDSKANIKLTYYKGVGHGTWWDAYEEEDFFPFMTRAHKANPVINNGAQLQTFEDGKRINTEFVAESKICAGDDAFIPLSLSPGFEAYQWRKDSILIDSATSNTYNVTEQGTYDARVMRNGVWSDWSPEPIVVGIKSLTATPNISPEEPSSVVLPSLDGSTSVLLGLPQGYASYEWIDESTEEVISNERTLLVTEPMALRARTEELFSCGAELTELFHVVDANGSPKPSPAVNLTGGAISNNSIILNWEQSLNPVSNETGFEIFRGETVIGPYTFVGLTEADATSFVDNGLISDVTYFYKVRAVNLTGASSNSNQVAVTTSSDTESPAAPSGLTLNHLSVDAIGFNWMPATDDVGISAYDIYMNGKKILSTSETTIIVHHLKEGETARFYVIARDYAGNESAPSEMLTETPAEGGLNYRYFTEFGLDQLPDFSTLTPVRTGITPYVTFSGIGVRSSHFQVLWDGYISIPKTGDYTFSTKSDDGSKVYLDAFDEDHLVVNNDFTHGNQDEIEGSIFLTAGFHRIYVSFFEKTGSQSIDLYWKNTPIGIDERLEISSAYFLPSLPQINPADLPASPSAISATAIGHDSIQVNWTDETSDETGFQIFRSTSESGPFLPVGLVDADVTSFTDTGLEASTTYYYEVITVGAFWNSPLGVSLANATTGDLPLVPEAPINLTVSEVTKTSALITGSDISDIETSFNVYRSLHGLNAFSLVNTLPENNEPNLSILVENLIHGVTYDFYIGAANDGGENLSETVEITALNDAPILGTINDVHASIGVNEDIQISATDLEGDFIILSVDNLPAIATFTDYGDGTGLISVDASLVSGNAAYPGIEVTAEDELGASSSQTFDLTISNNTAPTLSTINDQVLVEESGTTTINFTFSDDESDPVVVNIDNLPSFMVLNYSSDGNGEIAITPIIGDAGVYNLELVAADDNGAEAVEAFQVTIEETAVSNTGNPPAAPREVSVSEGMEQLLIDWKKSSGFEDGFYVLRSLAENGTYEPIDTTEANETEYLDEGLTSVPHFYKIIAFNEDGDSPESAIASGTPLPFNNNPVISMATNASAYFYIINAIPVSTSDVEGHAVSLSSNNLPSFVHLIDNGDGTGVLLIAAKEDDGLGSFVATIIATDELGASSQENISIEIIKTPSNNVFINFNNNGDNASLPWNNTQGGPQPGTVFNGFLNENNEITPLSIEMLTGFQWVTSDGPTTGGNSGMVPDAVLQESYFWGESAGSPLTASLRIGDLDPTLSHQLDFISSRENQWNDGGVITYTINGQSKSVDSHGNTTDLVSFESIASDFNGNIDVTLTKEEGTQLGMINGIIVRSFLNKTLPVFEPILNVDVPAQSNQVVEIRAVDPADLALTLTASNLENGFMKFNDLGNGRATIVLTPEIDDIGLYQNITITAVNEVGYENEMVFTITVGSPAVPEPPVIDEVESPIVLTETTQNILVTATDPADKIIVLNVTGLPDFATFTDNGDGTGIINIAPGATDIGIYDGIEIAATNADFLLTSTIDWSFETTDIVKTAVQVNFNSDYNEPSPWNNTGHSPWYLGEVFSNFVDTDGEPSDIALTFTTNMGSAWHKGVTTEENAGFVPDNVLIEHFWFGPADWGAVEEAGLDLFNLDPELTYDLKFVASTNWNIAVDNGHTIFSVGNKSASVYVQNNITDFAILEKIRPDVDGKIHITMNKGADAAAGVINGIIIESYFDDNPDTTDTGVSLPAPTDLSAVSLSETSIEIEWLDNSETETGFEVYRQDGINGSMNLLTTVGAGVTKYTDTGLDQGAMYKYQIRAIEEVSGPDLFSNFSEPVSCATIAYRIFVQFNHVGDPAPFPWNSTSEAPSTGNGFYNCINDNGDYTGINVVALDRMNGSFAHGGITHNDSGIYPDEVIGSFWYMEDGHIGSLAIEELDFSFDYNVTFFGSFTAEETVTLYTIGDETVTLDNHANFHNTVTIYDADKGEDGEIVFNVTSAPGYQFGLLNSIVIEAYPNAEFFNFKKNAHLEENVLVNTFPNPIKRNEEQVSVTFTSPIERTAFVRINSVTGNTIVEKSVTASSLRPAKLNLPELKSGIYYLTVQFENGDHESTKIFVE